ANIASPLGTIDVRGDVRDHVRAVTASSKDYDLDAFVIGMPLNMDGSEGDQAKLTRKFGDALSRQTNLPVHYFDERLSSRAAQELLRPAELSRKRQRGKEDAVAAQVILQAFLDAGPPHEACD
ncbi:MAG: Holliday junction resolvase RuvX, partial [Phycisphaerae bacterium]